MSSTAASAPSVATIRCTEPATGRLLGEVAVDSPADVVAAIEASRAAQVAWGRAGFDVRRRVLGHLLKRVLDDADALCAVVSRDSGKTLFHSMIGEIWPVCEKIRWTMRHGETWLRPEPVSSGLLVHKRARVEYQPKGVIGVICPWNYPLQNVLGPVVPALFAGNGCVVKASEWVAWSSGPIQRLLDESLQAEGFDPALVRIVNGYGETGRALVEGGVDAVVFTGSRENGRRVVEASATRLIPVILELGGKDAMIVCDDADLDQAVHAAMAGVFINAGQNCLSSERLLVADAVHDAFVERVVPMVEALRVGDPLGEAPVDVGAMVSPHQVALVERLVDDAVKRGARAVVGGRRILQEQGQFYAPTVLVDVTPDMAIMQEETFGPIMTICRVRDDAHALQVANDSPYGLSSTVFTRDRARADWFCAHLVTGSTLINDFGLTYMAQDLPFGGTRESGFGRLNGREGLRACTNVKAILDDRVPHPPTRLFPSGPADLARARAAIRTLYGTGLGNKVSQAAALIRTFLGRE